MMNLKRIGAATVVCLGLLMAVTSGTAEAETLFTKGRTAIRARPGEQARIVVRVDSGEPVKVLERDGRWIKVEYNGQEGWVTRTSVRGEATASRPERPQRQQRERRQRRQRDAQRERQRQRQDPDEARSSFGRQRGDSDAMPVAVRVERARVFQGRSRESDVVFTVKQGDELRALAKRDGWFRVRREDGQQGWIAEAAVGDPAALDGARETAESRGEPDVEPEPGPGAAISEIDEDDEADEDPPASDPRPRSTGPASARELELRAGIGAGATALGFDYASDPAASASGFASGVALSGAAIYPLGDAFLVGADIRYLAQYGLSALSFEAGGGEAESAGFLLYDLDVGARAGYDALGALSAWARVGFYYNALYIRDLGNAAQLPREELAGLTAGLGVDYAIGEAITADVGVSALLFGVHRQTPGLQDGAERGGSTAFWASLGGTYELAPGYAAELRYRLGRHAADWTGASSRIAGASDVSRTDLSHQVVAGVVASF